MLKPDQRAPASTSLDNRANDEQESHRSAGCGGHEADPFGAHVATRVNDLRLGLVVALGLSLIHI